MPAIKALIFICVFLCHGAAMAGGPPLSRAEGKPFTNSIGMRFVSIPAGTFIMGSPSSERGRLADEVQHTVTLTKSFYMQATETTQGQWKRLMGKNPSVFPTCGNTCPMDNVSFFEVMEFIRTLNLLEKTDAYRLPSEAEWEYACRAGSNAAFGKAPVTAVSCEEDPVLDRMAWTCANSRKTMHPAGQKAPNAWGLYDMHGNVWEWCRDWYGPYSSGPATDPAGPPSGRSIVMRGGGFGDLARYCRCAYRLYESPAGAFRGVGFRLVYAPSTPAPPAGTAGTRTSGPGS